jgi:glycosyltransferase involved in cell wall biosynthesis
VSGPAPHPASPEPVERRPLPLLVVGWFPRADDPISGRFVADQTASLAATGRVAPTVVSFEPLWSSGDVALRTQAAAAWPGIVSAATAGGWAVASAAATGPPDIPVLRLGVPGGTTEGTGRDHQALHRAAALDAFLSAQPTEGWPIIHAHAGYPEGAAVARVAAGRGIPFVFTELATYLDRQLADPVVGEAYRQTARAAARVIAIGPGLADQIREAVPELGRRLVVIPFGVDIASMPLIAPAERDPDELLWVGYRRATKGTPTLLRAFAIVRQARPSTTLRMLGRSPSDEEEAAWHALARDLGVADAVRFDPPSPDREGVVRAMARAACFVHPSTAEKQGMVAIEALATGLPVVAADSGGVTEIMGEEPAQLGALVPAEAPEVLAEAILATLERRLTFDPQRLRSWVERKYSSQAVAGQLAALYAEVLDEHAASPGAAPAPRGDATSSGITSDAARSHVRELEPAAGRRGLPVDSPVVIVAFDRPALDRALERLPTWVLEQTLLVTRGPQLMRGRVLPPDLDGPAATLMAWADRPRADSLAAKAARPLRLPARRRRRASLERLVLPALAQAVDDAVAEVTRRDGGPVILVCLGGIDILAARGVAASGRAVIAPGGLRWLGDWRWRDHDGAARGTGR